MAAHRSHALTMLLAALFLAALLAACDAPMPLGQQSASAGTAPLPAPEIQVATMTPLPTLTRTFTPTPTETPPASPTPEASATEVPPTIDPAVVLGDTSPAGGTATPGAATPAAGSPSPEEETPATDLLPTPGGGGYHTWGRPLVIANYLPWYNTGNWEGTCMADTPAAGPYNSGDPGTISRHVSEARSAGIDGFSVHWGGPGDITDANLQQILGQGFGATVTFEHHYFYGTASRAQVISALKTVMGYTGNGSWLRYAGRPIINFANMPLIDTSGGLTPQQAWAEVRNAVDPDHTAIWMAEGLDPTYLQVFDGIYIYKIDHAQYPNAYQNAGRWAGWTREYEALYGPRFWMATIQPGWDDSRTEDPACAGVRVSSLPFSRDREGGAYYDRTFQVAVASGPDMLLVNSFNEWVEGSFIEPSQSYGSLYLDKTAQFAAQFHGSR